MKQQRNENTHTIYTIRVSNPTVSSSKNPPSPLLTLSRPLREVFRKNTCLPSAPAAIFRSLFEARSDFLLARTFATSSVRFRGVIARSLTVRLSRQEYQRFNPLTESGYRESRAKKKGTHRTPPQARPKHCYQETPGSVRGEARTFR